VRCLAHRGFAGCNPENTLPAVEAAAAAGADGIEVDIRRCGSGELVVVHDDRLDRLTDATGAVAETPLSTLRSLSVLDSDAGIPTLDAVFAAVPDDVALNLELKESGLAADTLALADTHDNDVLVSSFERDPLAAVRDHSDLPTALLFANGPGAAVDAARQLNCEAVHPFRGLCDAAFVDTAHGAGFSVNAWTVQTRVQADRLAGVGVDGLIVDEPTFC
jgi:glycerophosphoryl diester phosphodiesterase